MLRLTAYVLLTNAYVLPILQHGIVAWLDAYGIGEQRPIMAGAARESSCPLVE
jgi:hypothetical protein